MAWRWAQAGLNLFGADHRRPAWARGMRIDAMDWTLALTVLVVFSPQSTGRHYLYVLLPMILLALMVLTARTAREARITALLIALIFAALYFPPFEWEAAQIVWRGVSGASWVYLGVIVGWWVGICIKCSNGRKHSGD